MLIWKDWHFTAHRNFDACFTEFLLTAEKDGREYSVSYRLSDKDEANEPGKGERLFRQARTQIEGWVISGSSPQLEK